MQNNLQPYILRALEVPVPQGPARLVLIDSLIRNEQQPLVLWVIVTFVTRRGELRQWAKAASTSSVCDLIGQSYQAPNSGIRAMNGGDPYPAHNKNEKSLRETERH